MVTAKRFSVVVALAGYLLATTAVHLLHDHSAANHRCGEAAGHATCDDGMAGPHSGHGSPVSDCEDSCFACRFLAAKSIAPVLVTVAVRVEVVRPIKRPLPVFTPAERPSLPLSRGPPCV